MATLFALWWLYFAGVQGEDGEAVEVLGNLDAREPMAWVYIHLPLSLVLIGFGVAKTKLFQSLDVGDLDAAYVVLYLGSLATFSLLVAALAWGWTAPVVAVLAMVLLAAYIAVDEWRPHPAATDPPVRT